MDLKDSNTLQNLKDAFAGESQANRRYLYFALKADVEGENDVAAVFRSTAEGETGHAHGHLEYMEAVGDPDPSIGVVPGLEDAPHQDGDTTAPHTGLDQITGHAVGEHVLSVTATTPSGLTGPAREFRWTVTPVVWA